MVNYADLGAKNVVGDQAVVLTCMFNRAGQLIKIYTPEQTQ